MGWSFNIGKIGGTVLSSESQETAAATSYGVAVGKVREYVALLNRIFSF